MDVHSKEIHCVYAIIDEQSNSSLISSEVADDLGAIGPAERYYLNTCSGGREVKYGRCLTSVTIISPNGATSGLPTLIECDSIPNDKREIHTPMCLDVVGGPAHVLACHTSLRAVNSGKPQEKLSDPEHYDLVPYPNHFKIKESILELQREPESDVFHTSREDDEPGLLCKDRKFMEIMETGVHKNELGNWEMPLPFRREFAKMPNNRSQAVSRLNGLIRTLRRKPQMETDYVEFMQRIIESKSGQVWYLRHFGVYHPKKPGQIRVVFDSSAEYEGVTLNRELLSGPDSMNSLLGVLIRFRRETTEVMCDIEQMFHSFYVNPNHRDFLHFLWFEGNTPGKPLIEYRMNVHLFGNGPSPAIATFGLRKTAADGEEEFGKEASEFIHRNVCVDDGLASRPTAKQAVDLVTSTQAMLATANLRLHKIVSNLVEVMGAFATEDRGKGVRDLDLHCDSLPAQRSLGVYWNLEEDTFTFQVSLPDKPFTRRGVLSIVHSIYDPLGLAVPVLLEGRLLLQQLVILGKKKNNDAALGWDDPLPDTLLTMATMAKLIGQSRESCSPSLLSSSWVRHNCQERDPRLLGREQRRNRSRLVPASNERQGRSLYIAALRTV